MTEYLTGIRLTRDSEGRLDMKMTNGAFEMATNGIAAASSMALGVNLERSECLASPIVDTIKNPLAGIDLYGIVFDIEKSQAEKELEIRRAILARPGIKRIIRMTWTQIDHVAYPSIDVQTKWGAETVSVSTPL
jgi:hypothetical protein